MFICFKKPLNTYYKAYTFQKNEQKSLPFIPLGSGGVRGGEWLPPLARATPTVLKGTDANVSDCYK